jgi:density-regulated protein DRP1
VSGLEQYGVKLSDAAKKLGKKFACGASVIKDASNREQIDVQGDVMDELAEFLCKEWREVRHDCIARALSFHRSSAARLSDHDGRHQAS